MDLGLLPGTMVTAELDSPSGNCRAYRVRDALIALRLEQGDMIQVVFERGAKLESDTADPRTLGVGTESATCERRVQRKSEVPRVV